MDREARGPSPTRAPRPAAGVSLVEVLIGAIVLALVLVPSMNVILSGTRTVTSTRDHLAAVYLAQQLIELARTYPFDRLDDIPGSSVRKKTLEWDLTTDDGSADDKQKKVVGINGISYEIRDVDIREADVTVDPKPTPVPLMLFRFTIYYRSHEGKEIELHFNTAISQVE